MKGSSKGGSVPGSYGKTPKGSTVANSAQMHLGGAGKGTNRPSMGPPQKGFGTHPKGSNVAGKAMVHVGGSNKGSTFPNMMKGGSKPSGTSVPNARITKFHATRGASKL